jgi:hypothetical protein
VVKKRTAPKKPVRKKKAAKHAPGFRTRGDESRLDLKPLHRHIRKRIKDLKDARAGAAPLAAAAAASPDDTIERLEDVLETLEEICHPTMAIPI